MCELVSCDFMLLSPRKILGAYRKELVARGIKNPHQNKPAATHSQFELRKVGIPMLMKKLDLEKYNVAMPFCGKQDVQRVRLPINKHAGAPAVPQVRVGQKVRMCDVIAKTDEDKLGAVYHASITGKITDVGDGVIEIGV
jgi:hypothetical protein